MPKQEEALELAFLGGGINSAVGYSHFAASRMDGAFSLTAGVFSRQWERNVETAKAWHVDEGRVYHDLRELIDREAGRVDAVSVLTPSPDHGEQVCALLDAGFKVICEKPLALDLEEVGRIRSHLDRDKNYLAVTFNYTGYPMLREMRARCRNGDFGEIRQVMVEMPQESFARPPDIAGKASAIQNWRLNDGRIPMMGLDLGIHMHSLIGYVTGARPVEVLGQYRTARNYPELVGEAHILVRHDNDMLANYWFTKTAIGYRNGLRIRIFGDKGSAEWLQMEPEYLKVSLLSGEILTVDRASDNLVARQGRYNRMKPGHPSGFIEAFANIYLDIANDIRSGPQGEKNLHVFTIDEAEEGLALFETAALSNKTRKWEPV